MRQPSKVEIEEVRQRLKYDSIYWAEHCARILDKRKQLVPLVAKPWQVEFDEALEAQRAKGLPMRAIVLKARKLGFCLDPATRVLTADLRWLTLDEIEPGQEIVATDEGVPGGRGKGRKMRRGVVEAKREVREEAFLLTMDNGERVVATGPHRFLCRRRGGTEADWRPVEKMVPGDLIRHVTQPWDGSSHEDGWIGGMIDGEGSLAGDRGGSADLSISQRPGDVYDRVRDYAVREGYSFREEISDRSARGYEPCCKVVVGRMNELFRLIGKTRPTRFVNGGWWENRDLPGKRTGVAWSRVVSIRPLGKRRMIDLQTSHKTFIAEGFVSHNSTWVAAKFLQRLTQLPDQQAIIVAQDVKTAGQIFEIAKRIHAHLPTYEQLGMGFSIRPDITGASFSPNGRKFVSFGDRVRRGIGDSLLEIDTANAPEAGRGYTPSLLHLSEVARWPERATSGPQSKMLAVLNAVPYVEETIVVQESTANGLNHFYRRWISARDGVKDDDTGETYVPIFVPWWRDPECAMVFPTDAARERFVEGIGDTAKHGQVAEDEDALIELYELTPEQLFWRRMMIRTQHEESVELFKQENPASDEEAFISSGRPYFSGILVAKAIKAAEAAPEPVLGTLAATGWREKRTRGGTIHVPTGVKWVPAAEAKRGMPWSLVPGAAADESLEPPLLEVWEHPVTAESQEAVPREERRPVGAYVATVDVAEGEADTFQVGDFHAVTVWDHRSRMQVAQYESRIDRHLLPLWIFLVASYFNEAWLAVEVNSVGTAIVDPLGKDYKYRHLYRRRRVDTVRNTVTDKPGWKTSPETKPQIENAFGSLLQSDVRGGLRSTRAARQLSTYIQDDRGRRGAQAGENDDLLMAAMIAARVMEEITPRSEKSGGRRVRGLTVDDPLVGW